MSLRRFDERLTRAIKDEMAARLLPQITFDDITDEMNGDDRESDLRWLSVRGAAEMRITGEELAEGVYDRIKADIDRATMLTLVNAYVEVVRRADPGWWHWDTKPEAAS